MKNIKISLPLLLILIVLLSCKSRESNEIKESNNKYLSIYSGGYTVEVKGYSSDNDVELYVLHNSGKAKWMHIVNDGYGDAKIMAEKTGVWTANEKKITLTIQGNTGPIVEEYVLKKGRFVNTLTDERYLKRTK